MPPYLSFPIGLHCICFELKNHQFRVLDKIITAWSLQLLTGQLQQRETHDKGCFSSPNSLQALKQGHTGCLLEYNSGFLVKFYAWGETTNRSPSKRAFRDSFSSLRGDGELSLIYHCWDWVRPWLSQHPLPITPPCGLAPEQPQQPSVGHDLHHKAATAPTASPRAQVRASSVWPARCQHITQLSALGPGLIGLCYTGVLSFKAVCKHTIRHHFVALHLVFFFGFTVGRVFTCCNVILFTCIVYFRKLLLSSVSGFLKCFLRIQ